MLCTASTEVIFCSVQNSTSLIINALLHLSLLLQERTLRLRQGDWSVLEEEPQHGAAAGATAGASASQQQQQPAGPKEQQLQQQQRPQQPAHSPQYAELLEGGDWQEVMAAHAHDADAAAAPPAGAEAGNAVELTSEELAQVKQRLEALLQKD